jgi:hypothetical protein
MAAQSSYQGHLLCIPSDIMRSQPAILLLQRTPKERCRPPSAIQRVIWDPWAVWMRPKHWMLRDWCNSGTAVLNRTAGLAM